MLLYMTDAHCPESVIHIANDNECGRGDISLCGAETGAPTFPKDLKHVCAQCLLLALEKGEDQ